MDPNVSRAEQLFGIDLRSLTAFRIGLAALLLADLAYRAVDFQAHHTDQGVFPRALYLEIFSNVEIAWSLHLIRRSATYTALLFWALFLPLASWSSMDRRATSAVQPRIELSPASVALLIQVVLIYLFSGTHKLLDPAWTQLTAVADAMCVEGVWRQHRVGSDGPTQPCCAQQPLLRLPSMSPE